MRRYQASPFLSLSLMLAITAALCSIVVKPKAETAHRMAPDKAPIDKFAALLLMLLIICVGTSPPRPSEVF